MFFNRNYIPAVPIREEQRLSEEEELARALKREARIFFPDKKLPDLDEEEHDAVCREEDSLRREADGSISRHELEAARQEAEQIARNRQQLQNSGLSGSLPAGASGYRSYWTSPGALRLGRGTNSNVKQG